MNDFEYHRPSTLAEAREALARARDGTFLAGGMSLLPVMKLGLAQPSDLISLADVEELRGIEADDAAVTVGAGASHAEVADSDGVRERIPALADLARGIGDPQVRNRGTLGGSLAHNDPAADYPAGVLGLGATVVTDQREIAADDFFTGLFQTALEEGEIITGVRFPVPGRAAYAKFPSPASRYALAGVMVSRGDAGVRVAVSGAGSTGVFRVEAMEEALASDFAPGALEGIGVDPGGLVSDVEASAEYRAHLVGVMARRAVEACA